MMLISKFMNVYLDWFFTSSLKIPHSIEIAGIFSDSNCTEIIRYTDINPSYDTESKLSYKSNEVNFRLRKEVN